MPEQRRFGKPRTEAQRRKRHKRLYPGTKLPPRGTGLKRRGWADKLGNK
jgi:hypothetical protein